jgi:prepilin-type N-terminal cleavage/methylation domain-containing protein
MVNRSARGFSLLELAVTAVVLSILFAIFLERLTFYQQAAERAQFERELQVYKTALQIRLAELMLARREGEARTLEAVNPTQWLSERPANYGGEYPRLPQPGNWYYDAGSSELVYVVNSVRGFAMSKGNAVKQLRFRVKVIYQPVRVAGGFVQGIGGIALVSSGPT